ncbi:MAG: hypothetical protein QOJ42_6428 [Acidobacteriaceae bacterium]|nr:hypothetical protein [Acidobacteriaceae bacterium]
MNSAVIDVAIGMIFIYLLLSLIASVVQEILSAVVQSRAANLQRGIRSLLSGDSVEPGSTLVDSLYNHGLIRGLYRDPVRDLRLLNIPIMSRMRRFQLVLQRWVGMAPEKAIAGISDPLLLPAYIPARTFAIAMVDLLHRAKSKTDPAATSALEWLGRLQAAEPDNKAVEAFVALLADADQDIPKFQNNLENWYNDAMDRVSGWYKKYTQKVLLVIGLLLALVFNVDSVRVARTLWISRDARQSMVAAADRYLQDHRNPAAVDPASISSQSASVAGEKMKQLKSEMENTVGAFSAVTNQELIPIGWRHHFSDYKGYVRDHFRSAFMQFLKTIPGWLVTAAALSLGAPFWFDTLNKFMVVRSTVKPREKSQPEETKDK